MLTRTGSIAALATMLLASVSEGQHEIVVPTKQHDTLDLELQSRHDNITMYFGDPQQLLLMDVRPRGITPRVEYAGQAEAILRIRDADLLQGPSSGSEAPSGEPKSQDAVGQTWEIRLCPSGPITFVLQLEGGESTFDLTDFQVQKVNIEAPGTTLDVDFSRQNSIELQSFNAIVSEGSFQFHKMLNARAREIVLNVPKSACRFEVTGKQFEGESAINFQGVPAGMKLVVSRKVGLRVGGPAATTARFQAANMSQAGEVWVSKDYDKAKCRVQLTFAEDVPALQLSWE
jgi:hypothetical protein